MPPAAGTTDYEWPTDTRFRYTRVFNAPRELVYAAYTEAEHVVNWLGFPDDTMTVPTMDLRVGGTYRWEWYRDGELLLVIRGEYTELRAPEFIANTEIMEFGGMTTPSSDCTLTFTEEDGTTTVVGVVEYADAESAAGARASGMTSGMDVSFGRLDSLLAAHS